MREGVQLGYLSPTHPHLATGRHPPLETFNFLARSRVQVDTAVQNRLVEEHQRSEALRGDGIVLLLPDTVCSFHSTDGGDFFLQGLKAESPSRTSKYPSSCFWIIIRFLTGLGKSVH